MKAERQKELERNWLVVKGEEPLQAESYQIRMLTGNMIPSILKVRLRHLDGESFLCYDITLRHSMEEEYRDALIPAGQIRMILESCLRAAEEMQEYLLDIDRLILKPEYIFTAVGEKRLYFCCAPDEKKEFRVQLAELMEYLLPKLDHGDPEAVAVGYRAYRCMMEDRFSMEMLRKSLFDPSGKLQKREEPKKPEGDMPGEERFGSGAGDLFRETGFPVEREERTVAGLPVWGTVLIGVCICLLLCGAWYLRLLPQIPMEILLALPVGAAGVGLLLFLVIRALPKKKTAAQPEEPETEPPEVTDISDFPGYEEEQESEKTEILWEKDGKKAGGAVLVSCDPAREDVRLDRTVVLIGKMKTAVDAAIPCPTVSRIHAKCRVTEENCYLTDLHSKNGTRINDSVLGGGEEILLREGDHVFFAEAEYVYRSHFE